MDIATKEDLKVLEARIKKLEKASEKTSEKSAGGKAVLGNKAKK